MRSLRSYKIFRNAHLFKKNPLISNIMEEWNNLHIDDFWVYNKLIISKKSGYTCGPIGVSVPKPGFYIIRPMVNFLGMGINSRIEWIENETDHYHPGEFWCEVLSGEHLSVDFYKKESKLVVKGTREPGEPLYKWKKWEKIDKIVKFPKILNNLKGEYDWINCEFIENRLIEVHFRQNPDFRHGNSVAIPVWKGDRPKKIGNYTFVEDKDYLRRGFFID